MRLPSIALALLAAAQSLAAEFDWSSVFKEGLVDAGGESVPVSSLKGKVVAVYFSAQWCPPCRGFTPSLVTFANENKDKLAVVFVSSDRGEAAQTKYMTEYKMPWPATPNGSPAGKGLAAKHGIRGIPTLLVFSKEGELITENGRDLSQLRSALNR